jgi:predicted esterase
LIGHSNTPIFFHHGYTDPYIPLPYARLSYNILKFHGLRTFQVHVEEGLNKHDMTPNCLLILSAMIAQNCGIELDYLGLPDEAPAEEV